MPGWKPDCFKSAQGDKHDAQFKGSQQTTTVVKSQHIPEERKGTSFVELTKKEGCGLGLTISGGIDKEERPRISNLRPGGIAQRSDSLEVGDFLVSVNGIRTGNLSHNEIINLLKNAGEKVVLEIEYELPDYAPHNSFSIQCKSVEIRLEKDDNSFGFTLRGGVCSERARCRPLTVTHIRLSGSADREGTLKPGDRLLGINGINVTAATLYEALDLLQHADNEVVLQVEYDVSIMDAVQNASGPLLVEIDKTPGASLGIVLTTSSIRGKQIICIASINEASIADRCGALHVGDQILSIDGTNLEHVTVAEAMQLLKASLGDMIKLELIPHTQLRHRINALPPARTAFPQTQSYSSFDTCQRLGTYASGYSIGTIPSITGTMRSDTMSRCGTLMSKASFKKSHGTRWAKERDRKQSNMSLASIATTMPGQIVRQESTEVTLISSHKGFGFSLESGVFSTEPLSEPPVIGYVEPGGVAERSGVIQEGDRLLAINGQILEDRIIEEVNHMMRESSIRCTIEIEFDVAESVVPTCGIFNVKLRKGSSGIGVTLACPANRSVTDGIMISDVKKGSVAYRCGSIHPGDQLMAIDNIRLEQCSVEDAYQILQNSDSIVKLRIKKDESYSDEPCPETSITYTVELQRYGGPLGITISGTEELYDPITISELTDGGLAERTGALYTGDRILAINGTSLIGHSLSDAIHMLQTAGETVTLKVTRPTHPGRNKDDSSSSKKENSFREEYTDKYGTPITSVDSALESWDGSAADTGYHSNSVHTKHSAGSSRSRSFTNNPGGHPGHKNSQHPDFAMRPCNSTEELRISDDDWDRHTNQSGRSMPTHECTDDWSRTLEDLQTCGQAEVLRQIEASFHDSEQRQKPPIGRNQFDNDQSHNMSMLENTLIPREEDESYHRNFRNRPPSNNSSHSGLHQLNPAPVMLQKFYLTKSSVEDFGFSLSDGMYDKAVFISALRPGGPADRAGLKPFDRILQVNQTKTRDFDCCLTVPLIAESGNEVEMVICRNPLNQTTGSSWQGLDHDVDDLARSVKSCKTV